MSDSTLFCPKCQSPAVTYSVLAGGDATCNRCAWKGSREDLLTHLFETGFADQSQMLRAFAHDLRMVFVRSDFGKLLAELLLKWGFVSELTTATLTPYLKAIALAAVRAVLDVRHTQETNKDVQNAS